MAKQDIDCEELIDQVYAKLNRAYEESYGRGCVCDEPKFNIVLSHEQLRALQRHIANLPTSSQIFIGTNRNEMFGQKIIIQQRTPYLKAVVGVVPNG